VNKLLGGPFFPDKKINVISEHGRGLVAIEVKQPKIIVGISLTPVSVTQFPTSALVFPAVVDPGCNSTLEIDERHLFSWNGTIKKRFDFLERRDRPGRRAYEFWMANIWLHFEPYTGPRFIGPKKPFHLMGTDQIAVMDPSTVEPDPRFPLLGLQALVENNLKLLIDGYSSQFDFYET
jgi:hypothetical protein